MGIKRGVSLYSYQQSEFFGKMTWKDQLREVATNLGGATGIEIISEATIPSYPMPPESFYFEWNNEMARWGLKAVTMDTYLDTLQFRDHVMTYAEAAEHIKYDLRIANKMGFENIRLVHNVPFESIEMALPLAEELNVRITNEIHAPASITPVYGRMFGWGTRCAEDVAFIQRTGTKHYGLQPDFGIFQHSPARIQFSYMVRDYLSREEAEEVTDVALGLWKKEGKASMDAYIEKNYPQIFEAWLYQALSSEMTAKIEDLYSIAPYIFCIHGKFYQMTEVEGKPGQYEEASIAYPEAIETLKNLGYDGYIDSEYEGQRSSQDLGSENLPDDVEEVRRHHEMMKRLIGA